MTTNNTSKRKRIFRIGFLCLMPIALFSLLVGWYFWSNAGRSQDRYGVLSAMTSLRFSDKKIVAVSGRPDIVLAKAEFGQHKTLNNYMSNLGWKYVEQAGAVSYFRKSGRKRKVFHLAMTRYFTLHTLKPEH